MPDAGLLERVLTALERGVPPEAAAIAAVVGAAATEVEAALSAVADYRCRVAAERVRTRGSAGIDTAVAAGRVPAGTRLGDFVVEAELGHGAMGVVYRARQVSLGRAVALKVLPDHLARDERFVARFRREATLAAAIRHPHLAEVHGFVEDGGCLAFAMRLVTGPTLYEVLLRLARSHVSPVRKTAPDHVRRCVLLVRALADALAVIHAQGFVHRDVKPSNILLEGDKEEALDAVPVIVDFGLLRPTGDSTLTNTNTMIGTPAYAPHESMLGQGVDARADVFSLGATLYDLLTLTSPGTRGPATAGLLDARAVNPTVDARLAAIVAMALQPDRALRYEHGGALRDELDSYLRGEPIRALPSGSLGKLRMWIRRDRVRAARVAIVAVVALAAISGTAIATSAAWVAWSTAGTAARAAQDGELLEAVEAYGALRASPVAFLPWLDDDLDRGRKYLDAGAPLGMAIQQIRRALDAHDAGMSPPEVLGTDLRVAHDRLLRLAFDPRHAAIHQYVQAFLLREIRAHVTRERRLAALDSLTWYLTAKAGGQTREPRLLQALLDVVVAGRDSVDDDILAAATAALGAIRTAAAFGALVELLHRDLPSEASRLAGECSSQLFAWLYRDSRHGEFAALDVPLLQRWGAGAARFLPRTGGPTWDIARAIAFWELNVGAGPSVLNLPPDMAKLVATLREQLSSGQTRLDTADLVSTLWCEAGGEVPLAVRSADASARDQASRLRFESCEPVAGDLTVRARVEGTAVRAACVGGQVMAGDQSGQDPYLRLDHPGQSRLTIVTEVPADAIELELKVHQIYGSRPVLRGQGTVFFRLGFRGVDAQGTRTRLAWDHSSLSHNADLGSMTSSVTVPLQVLRGHDRVELVYEYVRGDTTDRIYGVDFKWARR